MNPNYFVLRNYSDIEPFLNNVIAQADKERTALGWLPPAAYTEAARQGKLLLLVAETGKARSYAGHLLFGGIFPTLRVGQTCIANEHRRRGHATTLIRTLVAKGEKEGYLAIVANVASDLTAANKFYGVNGFATSRSKRGGSSRNRTINIRVRELETPSLLSLMREEVKDTNFSAPPKARAAGIPIYVMDLNVLFDAVQRRERHHQAGALIEAALNHRIRLAVSHEFVKELKRSSPARTEDPLLTFAQRLPTLAKQEVSSLASLKDEVAKTIFSERFASSSLTKNDLSDVMHVVETISAGASGYITSDAKVLSARDTLMSKFRLDIIGLAEFAELLEIRTTETETAHQKRTESFLVRSIPLDEAIQFLSSSLTTIPLSENDIMLGQRISVEDGQGIIGTSVLVSSSAIEQPSQSLICVRQDHPFSSTIADFLIADHVKRCTKAAASHLSMIDIPSHPITRRIALGQGFRASGVDHSKLWKISLGRPVTQQTWEKTRLLIERLTGLRVQSKCPSYQRPVAEITAADSQITKIDLHELETLLSPTLFILPHREAVIVPITRAFASDLLGTDDQYWLLDTPEAQFLSRRTYFNTIRAARAMIRGAVIVFYESSRNGGRGAVVALGRIVDVTATHKNETSEHLQRGGVVTDLQQLNASTRVLASTFDNLLMLKNPVSFEALKKIGCVNRANLVSATPITSQHLAAIVKMGFANEAS